MKRSNIRSQVIREMYGTSLRFLLEQDAPPPDPTATPAAPPADPAADAAAAAPPPADPAAAVTAAAAPAVPPPAPGAPPTADPLAGAGAALAAPPAAPGLGAPTVPAPGAPAAPAAKPPNVKIDSEHLGDPISKFLTAAEKKAIDKGKGKSNESSIRSLRRGSLSFLLEADDATDVNEPELDIETYVDEVKRLILNYDSLIDIKGTVIKKAKEYLTKNYPKTSSELISKMDRLLKLSPNVSLGEKETPPDDYAAEAGTAKSGGAA
jgi:hypothetical protein